MKKVLFLVSLSFICFSHHVVFTKKSSPKHLSPQLIPWRPHFSALPDRCTVTMVSQAPYIATIDNFLTAKETQLMKKLAEPLLSQSLVIGNDKITDVSPERTSRSAFLTDEVITPQLTKIRQRAAHLLRKKLDDVEYLQVVTYKDGQRYNPHFDYFDRSLPSGAEAIGTQGQRIATLLVYLNDVHPDAGGATLFPKVHDGLKIMPKKGMAVFWYNVTPDGKEDSRTLHGGMPVDTGEKWAVNIWIRDPRLVKSP